MAIRVVECLISVFLRCSKLPFNRRKPEKIVNKVENTIKVTRNQNGIRMNKDDDD